MDLCYPFRKRARITKDWNQLVEFPVGSGKLIAHAGQDTSNRELHAIAEREKNDDYLDFLAMTDGVVREVKSWGAKGSLGMGVQVFYPSEKTTKLTLHVKEVAVKVGQNVKLGQKLGVVGVAKGQTIAEHTHEQYEKGDVLSTGTMGANTQNPYNYTKRMKLLSEIHKPTEPTVTIKESVYKKLNQDYADSIREVTSLKELVNDKNTLITGYLRELNSLKSQRDNFLADITNTFAQLGIIFDPTENWDLQKYKVIEAIQKIKENATKQLSTGELLVIILSKLLGKT